MMIVLRKILFHVYTHTEKVFSIGSQMPWREKYLELPKIRKKSRENFTSWSLMLFISIQLLHERDKEQKIKENIYTTLSVSLHEWMLKQAWVGVNRQWFMLKT